MEFKKQESAGYLVNHMARLFARELAKRIAPLGLSPGQFPILLELWERDGVTQKNLVDRLDVEQATMANTLARMERDGLITRKSDPNDSRSRLIRLTARAKALEMPAKQAANAVNQMALGGFDKEESAKFLSLVSDMIARLGAQDTGGPSTE